MKNKKKYEAMNKSRDSDQRFGAIMFIIWLVVFLAVYSFAKASVNTGGNVPAYMKQRLLHNVKDYGAKGDGATNDSAAIAAAIAACDSGDMVVFPMALNYYYKPGTQTIPSHVTLEGCGWFSKIVGDSTDKPLFRNADSANGDTAIVLKNLFFDGKYRHVSYDSAQPLTYDMLLFDRTDGVRVEGCWLSGSPKDAMKFRHSTNFKVINSIFSGNGEEAIGISGHVPSGGGYISGNTFIGYDSSYAGTGALLGLNPGGILCNAPHVKIEGNDFYYYGTGVDCNYESSDTMYDISVVNNHFYEQHGAGVAMLGVYGSAIKGNFFRKVRGYDILVSKYGARNSEGITIADNKIDSTFEYDGFSSNRPPIGILLEYGQGHIVHHNTSLRGQQGISIVTVYNSLIANNICLDNDSIGIKIYDSDTNIIMGNRCSGAGQDFGLRFANNEHVNNVFGNILLGNDSANLSQLPSDNIAFGNLTRDTIWFDVDGNMCVEDSIYGDYWHNYKSFPKIFSKYSTDTRVLEIIADTTRLRLSEDYSGHRYFYFQFGDGSFTVNKDSTPEVIFSGPNSINLEDMALYCDTIKIRGSLVIDSTMKVHGLRYPTDAGSAGYQLTSNGSDSLYWAAAGGAGSGDDAKADSGAVVDLASPYVIKEGTNISFAINAGKDTLTINALGGSGDYDFDTAGAAKYEIVVFNKPDVSNDPDFVTKTIAELSLVDTAGVIRVIEDSISGDATVGAGGVLDLSANAVDEDELNMNNSPADNDLFAYNGVGSNMEWQSISELGIYDSSAVRLRFLSSDRDDTTLNAIIFMGNNQGIFFQSGAGALIGGLFWDSTNNRLYLNGTNIYLNGDLSVAGDDITMGTNTAGHILIGDGTNYNPTAMSGDITIDGTGVTAIGANKIDSNNIVDHGVGLNNLAQEGATTGQVIKWDGSDWNPGTDNSGGSSYNWLDSAEYYGLKFDGDTIYLVPSTGDTCKIYDSSGLVINCGSGASSLDSVYIERLAVIINGDTMRFPRTEGTSGQVLKYDDAGDSLYWANDSVGTGAGSLSDIYNYFDPDYVDTVGHNDSIHVILSDTTLADYSDTYSSISHNHDGVYSPVGHDHDAAYVKLTGVDSLNIDTAIVNKIKANGTFILAGDSIVDLTGDGLEIYLASLRINPTWLDAVMDTGDVADADFADSARAFDTTFVGFTTILNRISDDTTYWNTVKARFDSAYDLLTTNPAGLFAIGAGANFTYGIVNWNSGDSINGAAIGPQTLPGSKFTTALHDSLVNGATAYARRPQYQALNQHARYSRALSDSIYFYDNVFFFNGDSIVRYTAWDTAGNITAGDRDTFLLWCDFADSCTIDSIIYLSYKSGDSGVVGIKLIGPDISDGLKCALDSIYWDSTGASHKYVTASATPYTPTRSAVDITDLTVNAGDAFGLLIITDFQADNDKTGLSVQFKVK